MLNFHKNHKNLVNTAFLVFLGLSILIAIVPAYQIQHTEPLPMMKDMTEAERQGLHIYVKENCVSCHTQQVRNIEMDNTWGARPSMASDYYYSKQRMDVWRQSPSLLGSERTGPDLTNVGQRQPGQEWHLLHMYNPRIVVKESIMPSYPWLFEEKYESDVATDDVVVPVPEQFIRSKGKKVVATQEVMDLIAYLQSLKQPDLGDLPGIEFIPAAQRNRGESGMVDQAGLPDGGVLYANVCGACHQSDGMGLVGAFPPLAGSDIVNDSDPEMLIRIILEGYDARPEYGMMVGFADLLTDEEVAAIATHERSSWGNQASPVTVEEVQQVRDFINNLNP